MEPEELRQKMFLHNCIVDRNYGDYGANFLNRQEMLMLNSTARSENEVFVAMSM